MFTRSLTREVEFILHFKLYHQYMNLLLSDEVTDFKGGSIALVSALKNNWKLVIDEKQHAFQTQIPMLLYHHSQIHQFKLQSVR